MVEYQDAWARRSFIARCRCRARTSSVRPSDSLARSATTMASSDTSETSTIIGPPGATLIFQGAEAVRVVIDIDIALSLSHSADCDRVGVAHRFLVVVVVVVVGWLTRAQRVYTGTFLGSEVIIKERFVKQYRHATLDQKLSVRRLQQVRSLDAGRPRSIARSFLTTAAAI